MKKLSTQVIPIILSGGNGTRLWPLSRKAYPKQLLSLTGGKNTMLQETLLRVSKLAAPIIVASEEHRFMVAEQLREMSDRKSDIILEPLGKNTAPAIALGAMAALRRVAASANNDPMIAIFPADHLISDSKAFYAALDLAIEAAETGKLVTFGITPTHPETGYGYIKAEIKKDRAENGKILPIKHFVEKPDIARAKRYIKQGNYYWNSGMFVFKASVYLAELKNLSNAIYKNCQQAFEESRVDLDFIRINKAVFSRCPEDSIDYAVMEKTANAAMVVLDAGWSDLGSWSSVWESIKKDKNNNVVIGDVIQNECRNSLFFSEKHLIAATGIDNLIVVDTADALLIASKDSVQDVKKLVDKIKESNRSEHLIHRKVYRPWGSYESIGDGKRYQVKRIIVKPGASLSLQMHHHRAEHWIVVLGTAKVQRGETESLLGENESIYIPLGQKHRLGNPGKFPLELIEVQSGEYLGEDDIVRFEDSYGRSIAVE